MFDLSRLNLLCEPHGLRTEEMTRVGGSQNEVFECRRGNESSILRVSHGRGRTVEQVEAELDWIEDLASRGIDVCRPRPSRSGRRCERIVIEGAEYLAVRFARAPGRKIEPADINDSLYARLGRITAQLHAASFDKAHSEKEAYRRPVWHASRLLTDDLDRYTPFSADSFRAAVRRLVDELRPCVDGTLGLIHADISFTNTFLEGERLWIFDFDNCEVGSIVQDLATILYDSIFCRLLNRVPEAELDTHLKRRWAEFLKGYLAVRTLEPIAPETLRRFTILREAVIYIHYCRVLDQTTLTDSWRAGMDQMRLNVERGVTQIKLRAWDPSP